MVEKIEKLVEAMTRYFNLEAKRAEQMIGIVDQAHAIGQAVATLPASEEPKPESDAEKRKRVADLEQMVNHPNEPVQELEPETNAQKRERIKARAREFGIEFSPSTRTATLEKLIKKTEDARQKVYEEQVVPKLGNGSEAEEVAPETPTATRDEAQSLLVKISLELTKEQAIQAIETATGHKRLKDVPDSPKHYAAIVAECRKVLGDGTK